MASLSSILKAIFPCLPIGTTERAIHLPTSTTNHQLESEKTSFHPLPSSTPNQKLLSTSEAADAIVTAMMDAEKAGPSLDATIQSIVHAAGGWSEYLAAKALAALEAVLKASKPLNAAMQVAYDKACEAFKATQGFASDHPIATEVVITVIALGILVELAPYVLELLGFAELGPVEGSWAALWQSRYLGMVPKGSLFSFFQRLGMVWKRV